MTLPHFRITAERRFVDAELALDSYGDLTLMLDGIAVLDFRHATGHAKTRWLNAPSIERPRAAGIAIVNEQIEVEKV